MQYASGLFRQTSRQCEKVEPNCEFGQLIRDIRLGTIDAALDIPREVRCALEGQLCPDPKRADELTVAAADCTATESLARRIWPHLHFILAVSTGTFELYGQQLKERYTGDVPIYSPLYAATEVDHYTISVQCRP